MIKRFGRERALVWLVRGLFAISITLLVCASINYARFDGVILTNVNAHVGIVKRGVAFSQRITLINLTTHTVMTTLLPTCGCATDSILDMPVAPLSRRTLSVSYRISDKTNGPKIRGSILIYRIGNVYRRVQGSVAFDLED